MFICGSFHHEEEDDLELWSPSSTSRKSRKNGLCRSKDSKNPYSNRGLDKFSQLLADLEDKRRKIYTQRGSEDISFVRFVFSNSDDCKPIVVKLRERKQAKTNVENGKDKLTTYDRPEMESSTAGNDQIGQQPRVGSDEKTKKKKKSFVTWDYMKLDNWRRPLYYFPLIIILVLLFLAVFGRSFAILCTSLAWYILPTIKGGSSNSKSPRKKKKKEYVRSSTDNKILNDGSSSPRSVITGPTNDKSPRQRGHRKSW